MDGGGYFTNMINDGSNSYSGWADMGSQAEYEPPPDVEGNSSVRPNQKRTKNFSDEEVSAWLNISMDAVQGTDQSRSTHWSRIHQYFHQNMTFDSDHSQGSLSHHWLAIQEGVNKFCGYLSQIQNINQSGTTIEDKLTKADKLFKVMEKRLFHLASCYNLAGSKISNKKPKDTNNSAPRTSTRACSQNSIDERENVVPEAATHTTGRPLGRKRRRKRSVNVRISHIPIHWTTYGVKRKRLMRRS